MNLNKSSSNILIHILNGHTTASSIAEQLEGADIRSIQRGIQRLVELRLVERLGASNNPSYKPNFAQILEAKIPAKLFDDETRPISNYRFNLIDWLNDCKPEQIEKMFKSNLSLELDISNKITAKELEHLTVELSWKSSALEGNTYTLLDTKLLLTEGVRAKNRTDFETQMILNHKDAIVFVIENPELFNQKIEFKSVEELHRIIGYNLGIESGVRKKIVRISASNYEPLAGPQQIREQANKILSIISKIQSPYQKALLALSLMPYLQTFEDGNKRTGRILANALLISMVGRGFSLRKVDAKKLALAYLSFYEFSSIHSLDDILGAELDQ